MLRFITDRWWVFLIRGIAAILFGAIAWAWPDLTVTTLVFMFGAFALVDGIFALISAAVLGGSGHERWLPPLVAGIAGIVIGVVTFFWPDITALALLYFIAAWAVIIGVLHIYAAIELRRQVEGEWALGLAGLIAIVFGVLVFIFPGEGAIALVWTIGVFAILFGIAMIALAFRLRSLRDRPMVRF